MGKKRPVSAANERGMIKFLTWLRVDKVKDVLSSKESLDQQLRVGVPRFSRTMLLNLNIAEDVIKSKTKRHENSFQQNFRMKFITVDTSEEVDADLETVSTSLDGEFHKGNNYVLTEELKALLVPVILCVLVVCDVCLLVHRVVRLCKILQKLIWGVKEFIPLDHIAGQIYEISSGIPPPKMYDPLEHSYNYIKDNREEAFAGGETYFFPQNMPNAKEDLLRDIWNHKKKQKPQNEKSSSSSCFLFSAWQSVCRILTSEVTWKFIVILALVWVVSVLLKLIDSLVTKGMFQYLLSVDILLPQLQMHYNTTNINLENYAKFFNIYLRTYNVLMDSEVMGLNSALQSLKSSQERGVVELVNKACSVLANTTAAKSLCDHKVPLYPDTLTIPACNFLPISAQPYIGMQFGLFVSHVNHELSPLV